MVKLLVGRILFPGQDAERENRAKQGETRDGGVSEGGEIRDAMRT